MKERLKLKRMYIAAVLLAISFLGFAISAHASINWGTAVAINSVGQPVDSITVNGKTVTALYAPRSSVSNYDSDTTYCCAAFVKRFYSTIFGVTVNNLIPGNTPNVSSGSFTKTTTPQVGDIAASSNHWAIVKAVSGNDVTLIEQNCWNTAYTSAMVGRVLTSESSYWYWTWSGNAGDLVAEGSGSGTGSGTSTVSVLSEFDIEDGVLVKYNGTASRVEIPDTVTSIGDKAFSDNDSIQVVTIPDTVAAIGENAFYDCDALLVVSMPQTVESIGAEAFAGCDVLSSISLPVNKKYTLIEERVFESDIALEDITVPEYVTEIKSKAFMGTAITTLKFPDSVTYICSGAFYGCKQLSQLTLPKYLEKYGNAVFGECDAITSVEIPKTLETIDYYPDYGAFVVENNDVMWGMFYGCDNLKTVTFEKGTTMIADSLFYGCTGLETIEIPDTVTKIGYNAFTRCSNLKKVTIPDSVTEIKQMAFYLCTALESVSIPNSVATIEPCAFRECTALSQVKLPKRLKTLGTWSFAGCTSLTTIEIPASLEEVSQFFDGMHKLTEQSPFVDCSELKNITVESGSKTIAKYLFDEFQYLESIEIPDTVQTIGEFAFGDCLALKEINLPDTVTEIGRKAFYQCASLQEVNLPDSVLSVGTGAFEECILLETVKLSDGMTSLGAEAFKNCTSLNKITLPKELLNIREGCFSGCSALEQIELPKSTTTIEKNAFQGCTKMTQINIYAKTIGDYAFKGCSEMLQVSMSDKVASIGTGAFSQCNSLETLHLSTALTQLSDSLFADCTYLQSVIVPYGVTKVGASCFNNCVKLTTVTIPKATTTIPADIFSYPDKVTIRGVSGSYAQTYAKEQDISFEVIQQSATALTLETETVSVAKGKSVIIGLAITPEDCTDEVTWSTSSEDIATVNSMGTVNGKGVGECIITASVGGLKKECKVTVYQAVEKITIAGESTISVGKTIALNLTIKPSDVTNSELTWKSTDSSIATVNQEGKVTGKEMGTVTITATAKDGSGVSGEIQIVVTAATSSSGEFDLSDTSTYILTDDNLLTGVKLSQNTVSSVTSQFTNSAITCVDKSGNQLSSTDTLGTGSKLQIMDGTTVKAECTVVITGDIDGDGKIAGQDVNELARACVGKVDLDNAQQLAADLDGDGKITGQDVNTLARVCVGKATILSQE